jgi:methionyl-tRNA formyltransferase
MQVRAFAGWPGTHTTFHIKGEEGQSNRTVDVRVIRTRVVEQSADANSNVSLPSGSLLELSVANGLQVPCKRGTILEILELQPAGKKPMSALAFVNGLKGRHIHVKTTL